MRNKGFIRIMSVLCIALVCLGGFSVTAFAQTPAEETETDDSGVIYDPQPLTPEGNMSLVDDIEGEAAEDKQFIVVLAFVLCLFVGFIDGLCLLVGGNILYQHRHIR